MTKPIKRKFQIFSENANFIDCFETEECYMRRF
jgi:hypothetical protein